MTADRERFARLTEREAARLLSVVRDQAEQIAALRDDMTISDEAARVILSDLADARRKLAAVEAECQNIANGVHATTGRQYGQGMAYAGKLIAAALAAGEAPTEPATCDMRGGEVYDFAWCETHDTTFALGDTCPGPVPQGTE